FWKHLLATTELAEPKPRRVQSLRTHSSETNHDGRDRDPSDFVRRRVDLEVVFASAETQKSFGQDRSNRSHQTGERTEVPAAGGLFQRICCAPRRLKKAIRSSRATRAAFRWHMALGPGRYSRV